MMCMFFCTYAKFLTLNAPRSVICAGTVHVVSRSVEETSGGAARVIVFVTVGTGAGTVTVGPGAKTVEMTVAVKERAGGVGGLLLLVTEVLV